MTPTPEIKKSTIAQTWRKANDVFLPPFIVAPNVALAAFNATVGAAASVSESLFKASEGSLGDAGAFGRKFSERVGERTRGDARKCGSRIREALGNATGRVPKAESDVDDAQKDETSNALLSRTLLEDGAKAAAAPLLVAIDAGIAAIEDVPAVRDRLYRGWLGLSRWLGAQSTFGVLEGKARRDADAKIRFGFFYMSTQGPLYAVARDFRGIVGGLAAFGLGDFAWVHRAARDYWVSMGYVYDKWLADETQPESDFPIGPVLSRDGRKVIERFPRPFVCALETEDPAEIGLKLIRNRGEVFTLLRHYPSSAYRVTSDVMKFIGKAWLQVSDSLDYALCQLALVEGGKMSPEQRLAAERKLRKTANNATIEFEYYVPLVVPFHGKPLDQAHRRNVVGESVDHGTICEAVFEPRAIHRAQAITAEVIQLRAFLWLFGDLEKALVKSREETERKFGHEVAERIFGPLHSDEEQASYEELKEMTYLDHKGEERKRLTYPLSQQDIALLTEDARRDERSEEERVQSILYELLHQRGLLQAAEQFFRGDEVGAYESGY